MTPRSRQTARGRPAVESRGSSGRLPPVRGPFGVAPRIPDGLSLGALGGGGSVLAVPAPSTRAGEGPKAARRRRS